MIDLRNLELLILHILMMISLSVEDESSLERIVIEDLQVSKTRGITDIMPDPAECWFEHFTAACCINLKYRTGEKDEKNVDVYGVHRACFEAGIEVNHLQAFVRAIYDGEVLGKEVTYKIGKFCWPLPGKLQKLNICMWIWHVNVSVEHKFSEACFLFSFTDYVHVKFDCLRWESGQFTLHHKILPTKDQAIFSLYMGVEGLQINIKNYYVSKFWKFIKKIWSTVTGVFTKSKEMAYWISTPYRKVWSKVG